MTSTGENCALADKCECQAAEKPWLCKNWGRSSLAAPRIISAYSRTAETHKKRAELKEAAEYSILNNRAFTTQPVKGDKSPSDIRRAAKAKTK